MVIPPPSITACYRFTPSIGPAKDVWLSVICKHIPGVAPRTGKTEFLASEGFQAEFRNVYNEDVVFGKYTVEIFNLPMPLPLIYIDCDVRIRPGETATFVVNAGHVVADIV